MILNLFSADAKAKILTSLNNGEVIILPCDTIYGLCGKVDISFKKLVNFKGRPETKPFIQLATREMVQARADKVPPLLFDIWPAPLTAILSTKDGNTGFRVPDDRFLTDILKELNAPIYSTSVNFSGEQELTSFAEIEKKYSKSDILIVKGDETQGTVSSTIVDFTTYPYKVLREGAYDFAKSGLNAEVSPK